MLIFFFQLQIRNKLIFQLFINFLYDLFILFNPAVYVSSITIIHWLNQNFLNVKFKNMEQFTKWLLVHYHRVNLVHCLLILSLLSLIKRLQWRLERLKIILTLCLHISFLLFVLFAVPIFLHLTVVKLFFLNLDVLAYLSAWATYRLLCSFPQQSCFLLWQRGLLFLICTGQTNS